MPTLHSDTVSAILNYAGAGTGPTSTRHAPSYTDQRLVWFKGVDNILHFTVTAIDRRPLNLEQKEITITMWDRTTGSIIFRRRLEEVSPITGQAKLNVLARDLMTVGSGIYVLGATIVDSEGLETALTWNRAQQAAFDIEVKDAPIPTSRATHEVSTFTDIGGTLTSSAYNGPHFYRKDSNLFTIAIYSSNWSGNIVVQGTLDDNVTGSTLWANLTPQDASSPIIGLTGFTGIDPFNYYAGVRWVRIIKTNSPSNAGTLDKLLVRV